MITEQYSGIVINQNQVPASGDFILADSTWYIQEFFLPTNYRRGSEANEFRYPDLSGLQFLVRVEPGQEATASVEWKVEYQIFGIGWVQVATGVAIGAPTWGDRIWINAFFDEPLPIGGTVARNRMRIQFRGRSTTTGPAGIIVPYDGTAATVDGQRIVANLVPGKPYPFDLNGVPSFLVFDVDENEVTYSTQQGVGKFWYSVPNPLARPNFVKAYLADGITPFLDGGNELSFCFRVLGMTADEGVDFLGNNFRSVVSRNKSTSVSTAEGADPDTYWLSKPLPSKFAVENLYFDIRPKQGSAKYGLINLLNNPSGEQSTFDWTATSSSGGALTPIFEVQDGWFKRGSKSIRWKLERTDASPVDVQIKSSMFAVTPLTVMSARASINVLETESAAGVRIRVYWYQSNLSASAVTPFTQGTLVTGTGEKEPVLTATQAPSDAAFGAFAIYSTLGSAAGQTLDLYADSMQIVKGSTNIDAFDGDSPGHVWTGMPHKSPSAEIILPDPEDDVKVIDRVTIDPITPGVYANLYYTTEGAPGVDEGDWENKLWHHVPKTYRLERRETHVFPEPVRAKYMKIEFSHLQARYYAPGNFQQPTRYKKHPKWVLDYFLARTSALQAIQDSFTVARVRVIFDALDLAYNYYLDDLNKEPAGPIQASTVQQSLVTTFLDDRSDVSDRVDDETLGRINLTMEPYRIHPALREINPSLLGEAVRNSAGETRNYPNELAKIRSTTVTGDVSTFNREQVIFEQSMPVMYFYLTCRHKYREVEANFTHDRAYFVGIRQIAFQRDLYMTEHDTTAYIESNADLTNSEINEFIYG